MSNDQVDPATGLPMEEEEGTHDETLISFRIKTVQVPFFKRMLRWFYEGHYIQEPKLALLAKACLNIIGNQYEKQEQLAMASYIQKKKEEAISPRMVGLSNYQKQAGMLNPVKDYIRFDYVIYLVGMFLFLWKSRSEPKSTAF